MMFNLNAYARMLTADFLPNGGQIEIKEFHSPADFAQLRQKTLINATGYGARAVQRSIHYAGARPMGAPLAQGRP
jgi:D-amino-acid oxidase